MSVASSAASMRSVQFGGKEMSLEAALDETIRATQNHLNSLQVALRNLAACEDQQLDEFEDFKQGVALEDEVCDTVDGLSELLEELKDIARDIAGKPESPESKAWWRTHRAERRLELARRKEAAKAAAAAEKAAAAEALPGAAPLLQREMAGLSMTGPR